MKGNNQKNTNQQIKNIQKKRQERRLKMQEAKKEREQKEAINKARGKNVDIDFEIMIEKNKFKEKILSEHTSGADLKLAVCIRKRPIFKKQQANGQIDSISCANPQIKIHQPKYKVDGITKYVQNHTFTFDNTFNEQQSAQEIYTSSIKPLVPLLLKNGVVTCFAYGQTGSGKTYTMNALQDLVVKEMFDMVKKNYIVTVSFFQIYGGRCLDLLNQKAAVNIMQDGSGNIQIQQLTQKSCGTAKQLLQIMGEANESRTTHATVANDTSSRSHAICQIFVRKGNQVGKLVLVDLAGSQRAQDTQSNNRQRRMQGAEINKSLLALKQCIRAMGDKADHVPFRASKLTLILRDSFISKQQSAKVVMIACISPGSSSADHSLNTLRYADRLKDNKQQHQMFNKMVEQMSKKNQNIQKDYYEIEKQRLQKINSSKNIKKDQQKKQKREEKKNQKTQQNKSTPQNQKGSITPSNNKNTSKSNVPNLPTIPNIPNLPSIKKKQQQKKVNRVVSVKKTGASNKSTTNNSNSTPKKQQLQDNQIQQQIPGQDEGKDKKKKIKQDVNLMKQTMTNANKQEYFAFQEKVADILQEQEQVFATHMAAIKQDAKLLTQQSQLISKVQGVGYLDYDVDSYVQKLQQVIKKKLKIYSILNKKLDKFKGALKEQDEIRHKVKDTFYY